MATITVRVPDDEKPVLERRAAARGLDLSAFIRRALDLERDTPDLADRVDEIDHRLTRLEQVAGLE